MLSEHPTLVADLVLLRRRNNHTGSARCAARLLILFVFEFKVIILGCKGACLFWVRGFKRFFNKHFED